MAGAHQRLEVQAAGGTGGGGAGGGGGPATGGGAPGAGGTSRSEDEKRIENLVAS